jgi:hypothetical protein
VFQGFRRFAVGGEYDPGMKTAVFATFVALFSMAALPELPDDSVLQGQQGRQGKKPKSGVPTPVSGQAKPLPPVLEPVRDAGERRDLLQRFKRRHVIEGFYRLSSMVGPDGGQVRGSRGYMFIGRRHLTLQLYAPSEKSGQANIQSAVRTFRIVGNQLITSALLGHRNVPNGDIALTKPGESVEHRYELIGASLRLYRNAREHLEFQRIE